MNRTRAPRRWFTSLVLLLAPLFTLTVGPTPAHAAETTTRIIRVPMELSVFLPCANSGVGEIVNLSGTIMEVYHVTVDDSGGFHLQLVETQSGVAGTGETTGDRYVSTRVNLFNFNQGSGSLPITSTQELVFRIIGPGQGNDALIRIRNHSTINADGTMTVAFDSLTAECEPTSP